MRLVVGAATALAWLGLAPVALSAGPTLPSFIHRGLVVRYGEDIDDGYLGGVATTRVTGVRGEVVHATTRVRYGGDQSKTYRWTCSAAGRCPHGAAGFQFWVDPHDAIGSLAGQHLAWAYDGTTRFRDPDNHRYYRVGILHYQNSSDSYTITLYYSTRDGLIIESDNRAGEVTTDLSYVD